MSISLLPPSAPFTTEQRAWLDGFFAGLLGIQEAAPGREAVANTDTTALHTSQAPTPASDAVVTVEENPAWHDPTLSLDERLIIAEGRPLADRLMAAMAQLDCGACGYVCRTYSQAIARGEESNLTLCSPGGATTAKAIKRLLKETNECKGSGGASSPGCAVVTSVDEPAFPATNTTSLVSPWSRRYPFSAKLLASTRLNGEGSQKDTRHVRIDLAGSGIAYKVGDALGVFPTNCDALVSQIVNLLGATGQEVVRTLGGTDAAFLQALREANLKDVSDELMELLFKLAAAPEDRRRLRTLGENESLLTTMDVLDALQIAPSARPEPQALLETLSPLAPRLYSIASSPAAHGVEVHLTVGKVFWEKNGRMRKGVASTMLAERITAGDALRVFLQPSHGFTLPENPATPIIMVGPGTGIAPFRGFLHQRRAVGARGRNWLFFGDQHEASDFLYRDELQQFHNEGILTRLDTAFSRDGEDKVYVQHRMREHGEELFRWLDEGATLYVCGDASRMAKDVDQAVHAIIAHHGRRSPEDARAYVAQMTKERRYLRDVY